MFKNEHISDKVDAQGTAHFNEIRNSMVDAVNAYYTIAQYLLWANLQPPKEVLTWLHIWLKKLKSCW